MKKTKVKSDDDGAWKDTIEAMFKECVAFAFPAVHDAIDWSRGYTFLDKEFQKITRDAKTGKRYVDKLVQVYLLTGEEAWILLHLEVQATPEPNFEERIFVYHYRIFDYYHRPVISLVILTDDSPTWRPTHFGYAFAGGRLSLDFLTIKLLDYRDRQEELANHPNPFALVVLAHLLNQTTKGQPADRYKVKVTLIKLLYRRGFSDQVIRGLLHFIDWIMTLPPELELQLLTEVEQFEKEIPMPYITSFERIGEQRGLQQGLQQGFQQGIEKGIEKGIERGIERGLERGIVGQTQKLILEALAARFNTIPDSISFLLQNITDIERLQPLFRVAITAPTIAIFEQRLASVSQAESA